MATTSYTDATFGCRAIGARTDNAGSAATDLAADEDRLINHILTEGYLTDGAFQVAADSPASMDVIVGSGTAKADLYVVEGDDAGQHPYLVRLDDANVTVSLDASDPSNGRIDEIWLVVSDATWDAGSVSLPRIGYRKGTAAASPAAPGPDASWKAAVKLATITVAASVTSISAGNIADNRASANVNAVLLDAIALDGGQREVRESTEVASATLTTSYASIASVSVTVPSDWSEYEIEAHATYLYSASTTADEHDAKIVIDGTSQQVQAGIGGAQGTNATPGAIGARRTGMTSTGSRSVTLQAKEAAGDDVSLRDIYLYARAIRTS